MFKHVFAFICVCQGVCLCASMNCVHYMCAGVHRVQKKVTVSPGAKCIWHCDPPDVGARNWPGSSARAVPALKHWGFSSALQVNFEIVFLACYFYTSFIINLFKFTDLSSWNNQLAISLESAKSITIFNFQCCPLVVSYSILSFVVIFYLYINEEHLPGDQRT